MSEVDLLRALAAWHEDNVQAASGLGISITIGRTQDDRPKHAMWVAFEGQCQLGELMVWSSGEAEYMIGDESGSLVSEHHEVRDLGQLYELLGRLLDSVGSGP